MVLAGMAVLEESMGGWVVVAMAGLGEVEGISDRLGGAEMTAPVCRKLSASSRNLMRWGMSAPACRKLRKRKL